MKSLVYVFLMLVFTLTHINASVHPSDVKYYVERDKSSVKLRKKVKNMVAKKSLCKNKTLELLQKDLLGIAKKLIYKGNLTVGSLETVSSSTKVVAAIIDYNGCIRESKDYKIARLLFDLSEIYFINKGTIEVKKILKDLIRNRLKDYVLDSKILDNIVKKIDVSLYEIYNITKKNILDSEKKPTLGKSTEKVDSTIKNRLLNIIKPIINKNLKKGGN